MRRIVGEWALVLLMAGCVHQGQPWWVVIAAAFSLDWVAVELAKR